jgi:hypothetical protein
MFNTNFSCAIADKNHIWCLTQIRNVFKTVLQSSKTRQLHNYLGPTDGCNKTKQLYEEHYNDLKALFLLVSELTIK